MSAAAAILDFLKLQNFIGYLGGEGRDTSARQISLKSVVKVLRFFVFFQDGGRHRLGLSYSRNFNS